MWSFATTDRNGTGAVQMNKPTVFISYNWGSEVTAKAVESKLSSIATVLRDKNNIGPWGSISEFMKQIRKSDLIVMVISDSYLRSTACLYEIMQLMKDENWISHSMFLVEDSAKSIYKPVGQLEYIKYWASEKEKLEEALKGMSHELVTAQAEELGKIKRIQLDFNEFVKNVVDRNNPDIDQAIDAVVARVEQSGKASAVEHVTSNIPEASNPGVGMTSESWIMLLYAADNDGQIIVSRTFGGSTFLTGGKYNMNVSQERREIAKWDAAVQALQTYGYINLESRSNTNSLYMVTDKGYKSSDRFKETHGLNTSKTPSETLSDLLAHYRQQDEEQEQYAQEIENYLSFDPYH